MLPQFLTGAYPGFRRGDQQWHMGYVGVIPGSKVLTRCVALRGGVCGRGYIYHFQQYRRKLKR